MACAIGMPKSMFEQIPLNRTGMKAKRVSMDAITDFISASLEFVDFDHFFDSLFFVSFLHLIHDAGAQVTLEEHVLDAGEGLFDGRRLRNDVNTIRAVADEFSQTADLAFGNIESPKNVVGIVVLHRGRHYIPP